MATQGPNSAASFSNVADFGDIAWTNPNNAVTSDNSRATAVVSSTQTSQLLTGYNFGFSIPTGATITGFSVDIEGSTTGTSTVSTDVYLHKTTGGYQGYTFLTTFPTSESVVTAGGASSLFGTTWTPAQVNASTFGVSVQMYGNTSSRTFSIDAIQITVHYSEAADLPKPFNYQALLAQ